jgi:hypothetical protein
MQSGRFRTSSILISARGKTRVFSRLDQVPQDLRRRLREALHGEAAGSIVIADERGRERLNQLEQAPRQPSVTSHGKRLLIELAALGAAAFLLWIAASLR